MYQMVGYISVFESSSGYIKSEVAISHYIRLGKESGGWQNIQQFNCPVIDILNENIFTKNYHRTWYIFFERTVLLCALAGTKLLPNLPIAT